MLVSDISDIYMTSETSDGDVTMNMKTNDGYENNKC
jgi:hypothetical protein